MVLSPDDSYQYKTTTILDIENTLMQSENLLHALRKQDVHPENVAHAQQITDAFLQQAKPRHRFRASLQTHVTTRSRSGANASYWVFAATNGASTRHFGVLNQEDV